MERLSGASVSSAAVGSFAVLPLSPTGFSPSSGSIGVPFAITGSAFGPYAGSLTRVLFDGTAAPLSVWNDANINGTVPALSTGTH
ncbi:IPT/TIG domain-containing protein, partial [Pseudomonas aeruginosa]|uniref:IPT/TIG domain-containing protein n=1 Tax=Pseudomonas aeruginosa TaxID=287 RepID=UPI0039067894